MTPELDEAALLDKITRRLLGRHLITIDKGVRWQVPAITVTGEGGYMYRGFNYDEIFSVEYYEALDDARRFAAGVENADIVDNTL